MSRELDAEIAEKVFGWSVQRTPNRGELYYANDKGEGDYVADFRPSEVIGTAWRVVGKMQDRGWLLTLGQALLNCDEYEDWIATFCHMEDDREASSIDGLFNHHSATEAICRAALNALATEQLSVAGDVPNPESANRAAP